jgi:predicted transcriptional regulator
MNASQLRERLTKNLLDEIGEVQFPSVTMLNRLEGMLEGADALGDYAEILVEKVEATRFPSISMLNRVDGVIARLEQAERAERAQAAD